MSEIIGAALGFGRVANKNQRLYGPKQKARNVRNLRRLFGQPGYRKQRAPKPGPRKTYGTNHEAWTPESKPTWWNNYNR